MNFRELDSYKEIIQQYLTNSLNEATVQKFISEARVKNILGSEIYLKVHHKKVLWNDNKQYFVHVLDREGKEMPNPIMHWTKWETVFRSKEKFNVGENLVAKYGINKNSGYLYQLISPIENEIKKLEKNKVQDIKSQDEIIDFINESIKEHIKDNDDVFELIFDKFTQLYKKQIDTYNKDIKQSKNEQKIEVAKTKSLIEELQERVLNKNETFNDLSTQLTRKSLELENKETKLKEAQEQVLSINKLIEKSEKELKVKSEKLQKLIKQTNLIEQEKEEEIKEKTKLLEDIDLKLNKKLIEERRQEAKLDDLEKKFNDLEICLGFRQYTNVIKDNRPKYIVKEEDNVCKLIQYALYHYEDENLVYTYNIINSFYKSLKADQLVLLYRPSGTGKSSLINQFGKVINNCKVHHVAVQSSWTDTQDLLGFFNPIQKRYVPTPFLEALVEANMEKDKLHIITLDEMNLAHIEYYFASILSIREKNREERDLDLYSRRFYDEAKSELETILGRKIEHIPTMHEEDISPLYKQLQQKVKKLDREDRSAFKNFFELVFYYPAEFRIPKNVRFVGTLNMDETVKPISPKVIDRSFIIELDNPLNHKELKDELKENKIEDTLVINIDEFINFKNYKNGQFEDVDEMLSKIKNIVEDLDNIPNAALNSRGMLHILNYINLENIYDDEIINQIIYYKVLPRIKFSKSQHENLNVFKAFISNIPDGIAKDKASKMLSNNRVIQFWES